MAAYEIAVSLRVKDYFYLEKSAESAVAGHFTTFLEALPAFCSAVAFGYTVSTEKLNEHLATYQKTAEEAEKRYRLMLIRHDAGTDTVVLENARSDSEYDGEDTVVSCGELTEDELNTLSRHGIEPEEDSFGTYFEV